MTSLATKNAAGPHPGSIAPGWRGWTPEGTVGRILLALGLLVYLYVLLRSAWICDDAYITFRTIDNFLAGYGLTWNTDERVQTYTHPLWMFLLAGLRAITGEIYYSSLLTSMVLSLAAVLLLTLKIARTWAQAILGAAVLAFSKTFVDYSTSGLENPLSYLLVAGFLLVYMRGKDSRAPVTRDRAPATAGVRNKERAAGTTASGERAGPGIRLVQLSLLASLILLTRMDLALLIAPALLQAFWRDRGWRAFGWVALGLLPFLAWEVFSIIYYGFLVPNTAYAKLNTGIPAIELVCQGWCYFENSLRLDPLTLPATGCCVLAGLSRQGRHLAIVAGIALYDLYILRIGGDFMSGRFFSVPLLAAVVVLDSLQLDIAAWQAGFPAAMLVTFLLGLSGPLPPLLSDSQYDFQFKTSMDSRGVADERACYYQSTGLLRNASPRDIPSNTTVDLARQAGKDPTGVVLSTTSMGMFGYYAGPAVHIVDALALPDPLLARLPMPEQARWRTGHFRRFLPDGYIEGLRSGRNELTDLRLRRFHDPLRLITRGPLFSTARWRAILDMHLGRFADLVDVNYYRHPPLRMHSGPFSSEQDRWDAEVDSLLPPTGAWVCFDRTTHATRLEITLDRSRAFRLLYPQGPAEPVEQIVTAGPADSPVQIVQVPARVSRAGFDRLLILPALGDDACYVAKIRIPRSAP